VLPSPLLCHVALCLASHSHRRPFLRKRPCSRGGTLTFVSSRAAWATDSRCGSDVCETPTNSLGGAADSSSSSSSSGSGGSGSGGRNGGHNIANGNYDGGSGRRDGSIRRGAATAMQAAAGAAAASKCAYCLQT
jgi:hypothetical protein